MGEGAPKPPAQEVPKSPEGEKKYSTVRFQSDRGEMGEPTRVESLGIEENAYGQLELKFRLLEGNMRGETLVANRRGDEWIADPV